MQSATESSAAPCTCSSIFRRTLTRKLCDQYSLIGEILGIDSAQPPRVPRPRPRPRRPRAHRPRRRYRLNRSRPSRGCPPGHPRPACRRLRARPPDSGRRRSPCPARRSVRTRRLCPRRQRAAVRWWGPSPPPRPQPRRPLPPTAAARRRPPPFLCVRRCRVEGRLQCPPHNGPHLRRQTPADHDHAVVVQPGMECPGLVPLLLGLLAELAAPIQATRPQRPRSGSQSRRRAPPRAHRRRSRSRFRRRPASSRGRRRRGEAWPTSRGRSSAGTRPRRRRSA